MSGEFSAEQKRYLEGFMTGIEAVKGLKAKAGSPVPSGPDAPHLLAQDRTLGEGKSLVDQEKWKREEHPLDAWHRLVDQADRNEAPKPADNFRWRYHGLFYVAPAQPFYMCRMRIPNGILTAQQFAAVADMAERFGGGYAHVTTRANLQIREIEPKDAVALLEALQDAGLTARGAGADNIRNVTGSATAGIDPQELLDTRPHARQWHFHVFNSRLLNGLPRKFNVAYDGGSRIATLEDTNDIGFQAVEVIDGFGVPAGIYYRLALGGITGHKDLARDTGVILDPKDATKIADAIVRVFIDHGDRTNRAKARLKYVLDAWGFDKFLVAVEDKLGHPLLRVSAEAVKPRPPQDRLAHVGAHPQKQAGLNWVGVVLQTGKLLPDQMRGLADLSRRYGDGDIRLTVWQNLLISGVADADVATVEAAIAALGLATTATPIRAGLVACTGNRGCKFAASDTKGHAEDIAAWCEPRVQMDSPVNIHITGCHNSCAQHYIGDIGLIGAKVPINEDGDTVEGYNVFVGGGYGETGGIARELVPNVKATEAPQVIEKLLRGYLDGRADTSETFQTFTRRMDIVALRALIEDEGDA
jgi:ferredoxin-nitrite reductase